MTSRSFLWPLLLGSFGVFLIGARAACAASCPGDLNTNGRVTVDEILTVVNAALVGCPPSSQTSTLLKTGQMECDQGSGTLGTCPGAPPGQDGAIAAGLVLSYTDNHDGTITDNVTGLIWEKQSNDGSSHDSSTTYTWNDAFSTKIATLNAAPCFAGHCDWRLPNRRELESLIDVGHLSPAVDPTFNTACDASCSFPTCSCTESNLYWSSTTYQDPSIAFAWAVNFNDGVVNWFEKSNDVTLSVRAVRGGL